MFVSFILSSAVMPHLLEHAIYVLAETGILIKTTTTTS